MKSYPGIPFWKNTPMLRLLIPLVAGIIWQSRLPLTLPVGVIISSFALNILLVYGLLPLPFRYRYRILSGLAIQVFVFCIGCLLLAIHTRQSTAQNFRPVLNPAVYELALSELPVKKNNSYRAKAAVLYQWDNKHKNPVVVHGNTWVYFHQPKPPPLLPGARLVTAKSWQSIPPARNPGGFDFAAYSAMQSIQGQFSLWSSDWQLLHNGSPGQWLVQLTRFREKIVQVLRKSIPDAAAAGIAEALLIGYRGDLDKDLQKAYSNTGVVHIIAISGMHLGMIYGLLSTLLKPCRRGRILRWLRILLLLSFLWFFSLLAGAGASILRSAIMFSCLIIGEGLNRRGNSGNTLSLAAWCLLVIDPFFLWDIGFQLSFGALTGILLLYRQTVNSIKPDNPLLLLAWKTTALTLSAQAGTLPLLLFHFHQFPNLFLLTNLLVVPLSALILYLLLLLVIFYPIDFINIWMGKAVMYLIRFMNGFIRYIHEIPFASTSNISFDLTQTICLYILLAFCYTWLVYGHAKAFTGVLSCCVLITAIRCKTMYRQSQQQHLIVYAVNKASAMDLILGHHAALYADTMAIRDPYFQQDLQSARDLYAVTTSLPSGNLPSGFPFIAGHCQTWLYVGKTFRLHKTGQVITLNGVILGNHPDMDPVTLTRYFRFPVIVFDNSIPLWKIQRWKKQADSLHLRHHSVFEQGAWETDL